ncbi:MAG: DNA-processing protein DprA [Alphaproteobacteria bacterium]
MHRHTLDDDERRDWLRLARADNVGPITFKQLLTRFGSAAAALDALPELAARGGRSKITPPSAAALERELAAHHKLGARLLASCEPDYPQSLAAIEDAPPFISLRGNPGLLTRPCVAIVGARNASLNGKKLTETIARDLGQAGMTVVSGLARGIDTAAHRSSLPTGTVAVLAGGVDNIYPPENEALYQDIVATGCVIAEMPIGSEPRAQHFPRRNRIISGLSQTVLIVEAALQSGSLITARMALEQGRDVCAVPGSPLDPRATGTNNLIKQGATLVQCAADVIDVMPRQGALFEPPTPPLIPLRYEENPMEIGKIRQQVIDNISPSPTQVDEIIRECHVSAPAVMTVLLELELAGRLQRMSGNRVCLVSS